MENPDPEARSSVKVHTVALYLSGRSSVKVHTVALYPSGRSSIKVHTVALYPSGRSGFTTGYWAGQLELTLEVFDILGPDLVQLMLVDHHIKIS
jgi:hypothetical protein